MSVIWIYYFFSKKKEKRKAKALWNCLLKVFILLTLKSSKTRTVAMCWLWKFPKAQHWLGAHGRRETFATTADPSGGWWLCHDISPINSHKMRRGVVGGGGGAEEIKSCGQTWKKNYPRKATYVSDSWKQTAWQTAKPHFRMFFFFFFGMDLWFYATKQYFGLPKCTLWPF